MTLFYEGTYGPEVHPSSAFARAVAIIPARYGAMRFPGKPLVDLDGIPMVVRVAERTRAAKKIEQVVVATDDQRIVDAVERAGHRAVMTPESCASGTDRVEWAFAALNMDAALVINVQGDEPLIDPLDIDTLVTATLDSKRPMGTLARPLRDRAAFLSETVVKVVTAADGAALYFSRAPIPRGAEPEGADPAKWPMQHVGLYAYTPEALRRLAALPKSPLEIKENLEQLRAMENGIAIHVAGCVSAHPTHAIDVPSDVERVLELLRRKG